MRDYSITDNYSDDYKPWLMGGITLLIIFLAFFGAGIYLLTLQIKASRYTPTDAVVVDYKVIYDYAPDALYYETYLYVVEYESGGNTYRKTCDTPANRNTYLDDMGKVITIYVNPDNPQDAVFSNSTHVLLTVLCLIIPICGFVGTAFIFRKAHKIRSWWMCDNNVVCSIVKTL